MLLRSRIDGIDRAAPAQLVAVPEELDRASPMRAFTPEVGEYVPRHRKEPREA